MQEDEVPRFFGSYSRETIWQNSSRPVQTNSVPHHYSPCDFSPPWMDIRASRLHHCRLQRVPFRNWLLCVNSEREWHQQNATNVVDSRCRSPAAISFWSTNLNARPTSRPFAMSAGFSFDAASMQDRWVIQV